MQRSVPSMAVAAALLTQSCAPSIGARLGGALTAASGGAQASGVARVTVATRELPLLSAVGTAALGDSNHLFLVGGEVNAPLARGYGRGEYPKSLWFRTRIDLGYRTVDARSGAVLGITGGLAYPFFVSENASGTATHVVQVAFELGLIRSSSFELTLGPTLEYVFVPHEERAASSATDATVDARKR